MPRERIRATFQGYVDVIRPPQKIRQGTNAFAYDDNRDIGSGRRMTKPRIHLLALGGTIATPGPRGMTRAGRRRSGAWCRPRLIADIAAETVPLPAAATPPRCLRLAHASRKWPTRAPHGVVIAGHRPLEETPYIDCCSTSASPWS
jgi:hypothetical protein